MDEKITNEVTSNEVTIVTGFISNVNSSRSLENYISFGNKLINVKMNKIIFIDEEIYEKYYINETFENTCFVKVKKEDLFLYKYKDHLHNFSIISNNLTKDTMDYMLVMCNKTDWIKKAIELNVYNTEQFVWVDFGIYHIFNNNDELFTSSLEHLRNLSYEKVRIASNWNLDTNLDYYSKFMGWDTNIPIGEARFKYVIWYFLGGVFGGGKESLIKFSNLMEDITINFIKEKGTICWEVNMWYLVYQQNKEIFLPYYADHNSSILLNY